MLTLHAEVHKVGELYSTAESASEAGKISVVLKATDSIAKVVHASATKNRSLQAIQESLQQFMIKFS